MAARRGATDLSGVLAIDKPGGMTSHDVVAAVRAATGERRVGHAGTLDPLATGLLLVLVGPATRLERYLSGHDKHYDARVAFGTSTDTLDADGAVTATADVRDDLFDLDCAKAILDGFTGVQQQAPPVYSAIKIDGVPSHRRARAGEERPLAEREIVVHEAVVRSVDASARTWDVAFNVSKGTYVRSLARDIGLAAGTVAHLAALRRTAIGSYDVARALTLDEVGTLGRSGALAERFVDPVALLGMPVLSVPPHQIADGRPVDPPHADPAADAAFALADSDRLYAVYRMRDGALRAETVFPGGVSR
jgi:tRNA pseudouridine55 synthase